jgi:hypothetical protein
MNYKRGLIILLAGSILLGSVASHYAISMDEIKKSIWQYYHSFNEDSLKKIIPASIVALLVMGGLYHWWTSKKNVNQDVTSSYGESFQIQDDIKLIQFQVYCQFNFDGGGMASCGYHALLRGMQVVQSKSNEEDDTRLQVRLNDSKIIPYYFGKKGIFFGNNGIWRQQIIQDRKTNRDEGDWIDKEEIQFLWNNNKNEFISKQVLCDLDVVEDITLIGHPDVDLTTGITLEKIKSVLNTEKMYFVIFILGTMKQPGKDEELTMRYGHWYPLIMYQNARGQRKYYVMDSASQDNTNRLKDDDVWKIINLIEKAAK